VQRGKGCEDVAGFDVTALLRGPLRAGQAAASGGLGGAVVTVGAIAAGAALLEAALIPGIVIGGAAVLVPRALPPLRRRLRPLFTQAARPPPQAAGGRDRLGGLGLKQAVIKTITFRLIVTTLDFTTNYVVLGELATAAGLSAFALVIGPVFYLAHETAWNYLGPGNGNGNGDGDGTVGTAVAVPVRLTLRLNPPAEGRERRGFTISRALAKTITFRTLASTLDFTTNYVVVGDAAVALGLSAVGLIAGPFVYYGHEWAWDRYGAGGRAAARA
jgi:uncharacterized membrane protein